MITEQDLLEAIAECQGVRNPKADTCIKLAAFYTILDHVREREDIPSYSYASYTTNNEDLVSYDGDSEFARAVNGMPAQEAWSLIDELMDTLQVINKGLYNAVMRKLER